ncbi:acetylcholine receptor subunit gamma-like [Ostrea edulis]|uniref:acetylcholine receptor subunit gamma-like n=1 Tax=Ostrea edulis TaxID=37623 RepID=UPI0024AF7541|nr:acetylcholine receptor subunit gamma-like [Ostrea edulis]
MDIRRTRTQENPYPGEFGYAFSKRSRTHQYLGILPVLSLHEVDLKRNLLDSTVYDKSVRPRINATHTVNVKISVTSVYIVDLNEKQSSFSQAYHLSVNWKDDFLTWNVSDYEDIESFVCDSSSIWTPDVTIFGRMETNQGVDFNRVRVRSDGVVTTTFMGLLTTHCSTDPTYFPFDYQLCIIRLGSQVYTMFEVAMEITSAEILTDSKNNPNWKIAHIQLNKISHDLQTVSFCLQRKSMYLSALYMAPTFMHAVLVLISYMIPSETGEKISFGMSLFLSFMVFLLQLNGDIPEVSTSIPALGVNYVLSLNEVDLKRMLFSPAVYDKSVRPRINATHTVEVEVGFTNVFVVDLDEKGSSFSQACSLCVSWKDEFLTWNASHYEGIESFIVDISSIWYPDVSILGRMEIDQEVKFSRARVQSNGTVNTTFVGLLTTHCSTDPSHFPFDYQLCEFRLDSQIYTKSEVDMKFTSIQMMQDYKSNPNWNTARISFVDDQQLYFCLQRKSLYLSMLYMVPTTMHAVLILVSFLVPSESGEKISFGMSLFLSFMVLLLQLNGDLPEVSTSIPALEIYVMLHMVSGVVSLTVSSFTAYIKQNSDQSKHRTEAKVEDVFFLVPMKKERDNNYKRKKRVCERLRSGIFLNRLGFVVSFILILAANCVMLNAKSVATGCDHLLL